MRVPGKGKERKWVLFKKTCKKFQNLQEISAVAFAEKDP